MCYYYTQKVHVSKKRVNPMSKMLKAWERQPNETDPQFRAFSCYLNMPLPRSITKAYRQDQRDKGKTIKPSLKVSGTWRNWSYGKDAKGKKVMIDMTWLERVIALDNHLSQEFTLIQEGMRSHELKRELSTTDELLQKFNTMLSNFDTFVDGTTTTTNDEGIVTVVQTIGLDVDGLLKLSKIHQDITRQRRLALGLPDRVTETQIANKDGEPFKIDDSNTLAIFAGAKDALIEQGYAIDTPQYLGRAMQKPTNGNGNGHTN